MALFEFELANVELIQPWGEPGSQSLSWFALTDGTFHMNVGDQVLFQYSGELLSLWGTSQRDVDYQIASLARDVLGSIAPGTARLPPFFERLASDWDLLTQLYAYVPPQGTTPIDDDVRYNAWRWLAERSPWTSYFVAHPEFQFVRIGDHVHIHWDNCNRMIKERPAWSAQCGMFVLPLQEFLDEARNFADRLLQVMEKRIQGIEAGTLRPQVEVSAKDLRLQHEEWRLELASYFTPRQPDVPWDEVEAAIRVIAEHAGIRLGF
jgi:hypothetical protein